MSTGQLEESRSVKESVSKGARGSAGGNQDNQFEVGSGSVGRDWSFVASESTHSVRKVPRC